MRGTAAFVDRGRRTTCKCYNLYSTVEMLTTRDGPAVILVKTRDSNLPQLRGSSSEYCHKVWYRKTTMVWLPGGEKIENIIFSYFDRIHERDGQTDGQTGGRTSRDSAFLSDLIPYN